MELDLLKDKWAELDRKLDVSLRLNRRLLMAVNRRRVRSPLRRFAFFLGLGALIWTIGGVILGRFIYDHWAEPRFALPAVLLDVWVITMVAASILQMAMALRIDYDQPITAIQKQVESLRVLRIRVTQWAVLTGLVVWWTPFVVVALKGISDIDAYRVLGVYLMTNLVFGLAAIPLALWVARKFRDRMGPGVMQRLINGLAGYNLNESARFLATLTEFENETRE